MERKNPKLFVVKITKVDFLLTLSSRDGGLGQLCSVLCEVKDITSDPRLTGYHPSWRKDDEPHLEAQVCL